MQKIGVLVFVFLTVSCVVPKKKYDALAKKNSALRKENKSLMDLNSWLKHKMDSVAAMNQSISLVNDSLLQIVSKADSTQNAQWIEYAQNLAKKNKSEVIKSRFKEWNVPAYSKANTAGGADYLTSDERQVIYLINLMRLNPQLYLKTYYADLNSSKPQDLNSFEKSLVEDLKTAKPMEVLMPDEILFKSARCHATIAGKRGYVGHDRVNYPEGCDWHGHGECCAYGNSSPEAIVSQLLVDEGVPSLGHRHMLMGNYSQVGVSIQPHTTYSWNCVLDFD